MNRRLRNCVCVSALLAGCALGPDYHRPALEMPGAFRDDAQPAAASAAANVASFGDSGWWVVYPDPDLQALLSIAVKNSFDVKIAVARIDEARAQLGSTRLSYLPQVSVDAAAARSKSSEYALPPGFPRIYSEDQVQILASYQFDLWGQLRRANEAARANLLASRYAARAVEVTLVATVANSYFQLISLDSQLEITKRTVVTREKFLELTHAQHERGYATGLDAATAEAQLAAARATVPDLERQIAQTEDQISTLLGSNPGPITRT
jgi:outer membrane protein, multidrug efflux system